MAKAPQYPSVVEHVYTIHKHVHAYSQEENREREEEKS